MRRDRNVRIVATLGPASSDKDTIRRLFLAGADVFRLNMSHGTHDDTGNLHRLIREVSAETGRPIGIMVDLQGPKYRCGSFGGKTFRLRRGARFTFDLDPAPGGQDRVQFPHEEVFSVLKPGSKLLVNDGIVHLVVNRCGGDFAECTVEVGGRVSDRKGVNIPDVILPVTALSDKDREDLEFACELGVDWLALSFVQRPDDMEEARELAGGRAALMAKIEKPAAVDQFDQILDASDGIMIARGDLGVETPLQNVPSLQKRLIRRCRAAAKPAIVATQMLESMVQNSTPTRAEVSDVATAIYEGVDAIMLSAESAAGRYPVESVATMNDVAMAVECDPTYRQVIEASRRGTRTTVADAITSAAREIAETTDVTSICCFTHTGTTARLVARERPRVPTIVLTPFARIAQRLCLLWGAHCLKTEVVTDFDRAVEVAVESARCEEFGRTGDHIIIMAGVPFNISGSTNIIRVAEIGTE